MHITGKLAPLVIVLALAGCGGRAAAPPKTALASAVASASPTSTLSPRAAFILAYRQALAAEGQGSSLTDAQVYGFGKVVCTVRAGGKSQSALLKIGGNMVLLGQLAEQYLCPRYR